MCLKLFCATMLAIFILTCLSNLESFWADSVKKDQDKRQEMKSIEGASQATECLSNFGLNFEHIIRSLERLQANVTKIIEYTTEGPGRGSTYNELAHFVDTFGPRMSGSPELERANDYLKNKMQNDSQLVVSAEPAMVPR